MIEILYETCFYTADMQRCLILYAMDEIETSSTHCVNFKCAGPDEQVFVDISLNTE